MWKKKENLVTTGHYAATSFASTRDRGGISAESGSWGCTYGEWLIPWDYDPCRCTTEIKQKSNQASSVTPSAERIFPPSETFIKPTPLKPILEPLPCANIYHCLKVHLFVHQSFGDLCRLLEMDVIWRKHSQFTTWPNIKANTYLSSKQIRPACSELLPRYPEGALKDSVMLTNWE